MKTEKEKLAVLFPGLGYTCDKPLLYYAGKLARAGGYEVVSASYGGFPANVKGDPAKMRACLDQALEQCEGLLGGIEWNRYEEILLIGKSIGTAGARLFAEKHAILARYILFTPLEETFRMDFQDAIAFHGTADPWAKTEAIRQACSRQNIPLYITEDANHSLETGNVDTDLCTMQQVMRTVGAFMR